MHLKADLSPYPPALYTRPASYLSQLTIRVVLAQDYSMNPPIVPDILRCHSFSFQHIEYQGIYLVHPGYIPELLII
ncbi:hypothetical protein ES703_64885 [subsurface metagenome]